MIKHLTCETVHKGFCVSSPVEGQGHCVRVRDHQCAAEWV